MQGVYEIRNTVTGDCYIGSSRDVEARWHGHRYHLQRGTHRNHALQQAWNTHGGDAFSWRMQEEVEDASDLLACEKRAIENNHPFYNAVGIRTTVHKPRVKRRLTAEGFTPIVDAHGKWGRPKAWWYTEIREGRLTGYKSPFYHGIYLCDEEVEQYLQFKPHAVGAIGLWHRTAK